MNFEGLNFINNFKNSFIMKKISLTKKDSLKFSKEVTGLLSDLMLSKIKGGEDPYYNYVDVAYPNTTYVRK